MPSPLAYLLTWTTYGTWLPGDRRGWVNRLNRQHGEPFNPPSEGLRRAAKAAMKTSAVRLDQRQRRIVEKAIAEVCGIRRWRLESVNCRSNHVHVVVRCSDAPPDEVRNQLKAYATRRLREEGYYAGRTVWTRGGSGRHLNTEQSVRAAIEYVRRQ